MGQVIEVRFINPTNGEILEDRFTLTSSSNYDASSHEPMHREAIELALSAWSGDTGKLKSIQREGDVREAGTGVNTSWRYLYSVLLDDEGTDREMIAALFAQYKEI